MCVCQGPHCARALVDGRCCVGRKLNPGPLISHGAEAELQISACDGMKIPHAARQVAELPLNEKTRLASFNETLASPLPSSTCVCRDDTQAIMDDVAAREVPVYFEVEEEIISAPSKVCFWYWSALPTACFIHQAPSMGWLRSLLVGQRGANHLHICSKPLLKMGALQTGSSALTSTIYSRQGGGGGLGPGFRVLLDRRVTK